VFTARYELMRYIKQITFRLLNVNVVSATQHNKEAKNQTIEISFTLSNKNNAR
jgi:hypothetical protein